MTQKSADVVVVSQVAGVHVACVAERSHLLCGSLASESLASISGHWPP